MYGVTVAPVGCNPTYVPQMTDGSDVQQQQQVYACKEFSVGASAADVTKGVNEATKLIQSLTALLAAGLTLTEALKVLFPKSNNEEIAKLSNSINACKAYKTLDVEA